MSDAPEAQIYTIQWPTVEKVLWSEDEFDGIEFGEDENGTVVYSYDVWALNLFLLALSKAMGPVVEPGRSGFDQVYHTLAELTMGMSLPILTPDHGPDYFSCTLPGIRITGVPERN